MWGADLFPSGQSKLQFMNNKLVLNSVVKWSQYKCLLIMSFALLALVFVLVFFGCVANDYR